MTVLGIQTLVLTLCCKYFDSLSLLHRPTLVTSCSLLWPTYLMPTLSCLLETGNFLRFSSIPSIILSFFIIVPDSGFSWHTLSLSTFRLCSHINPFWNLCQYVLDFYLPIKKHTQVIWCLTASNSGEFGGYLLETYSLCRRWSGAYLWFVHCLNSLNATVGKEEQIRKISMTALKLSQDYGNCSYPFYWFLPRYTLKYRRYQ